MFIIFFLGNVIFRTNQLENTKPTVKTVGYAIRGIGRAYAIRP